MPLYSSAKFHKKQVIIAIGFFLLFAGTSVSAQSFKGRERISINKGWKFYKYDASEKPDSLIYDIRPNANGNSDARAADAKPDEAVKLAAAKGVLKPFIMPTGDPFIKDPAKQYTRPF